MLHHPLDSVAANLSMIQVEIRRRRYFVRRTYSGREYGYFDHGWASMATCPRCFFLKERESVVCSRCAADMRKKQPDWRGK